MAKEKQIPPLTSIRGLAALWVYLHHSQYLTSPSRFFNEVATLGHFAVDIFFILSGFIISYVHLNDFRTLADSKRNGVQFLLLRLARIYPVHLLTLLIVLLLDELHIFGGPKDTLANFVCNLLLLQKSWFVEGVSWNLVSWSIGVEWMLYLCFPLFALFIGTRLKGAIPNLILIALMLGLWSYYLCATCTASYYNRLVVESARSILTGAIEFTIGIGLYNLYASDFLKKLPWDWIALASLIALVFVVALKSRDGAVHDTTFIALFALLIYSLACVQGWMLKVFSWKPLVYMGTISYSFYMLHWIYVVFVLLKILPYWQAHAFFCWEFAVSTAVIIGISALCYHGFEKPVRLMLRGKLAAKTAKLS